MTHCGQNHAAMSKQGEPTFLSHVGPGGEARMVDVSAKAVTAREAVASAVVHMKAEVLGALCSGELPKGDALSTARVAGVLAAKRTAELIPLCHPLPLDHVQIDFQHSAPGELLIVCTAKTAARTGVEMEALAGATVAALTVYDMAKGADKGIVIGPIQIERKTGGKSGRYERISGSSASQKGGT